MYTPDEDVLKRIDNNFAWHEPIGDQGLRYAALRKAYADLAITVVKACPVSRELSLALTELENSSMWANAAIARNETVEPVTKEGA